MILLAVRSDGWFKLFDGRMLEGVILSKILNNSLNFEEIIVNRPGECVQSGWHGRKSCWKYSSDENTRQSGNVFADLHHKHRQNLIHFLCLTSQGWIAGLVFRVHNQTSDVAVDEEKSDAQKENPNRPAKERFSWKFAGGQGHWTTTFWRCWCWARTSNVESKRDLARNSKRAVLWNQSQR